MGQRVLLKSCFSINKQRLFLLHHHHLGREGRRGGNLLYLSYYRFSLNNHIFATVSWLVQAGTRYVFLFPLYYLEITVDYSMTVIVI
jgi:hypothetical protein